jgi:hypothetical protein
VNSGIEKNAMKKILPSLFIFIFLTGCVSQQIIPPTSTVRALKKVQIVALEPPPLEIPQQIVLQSALIANLPKPTIGAARAVGVVSSILIIIEATSSVNAPASAETIDKSNKIESLIRGNEIWIPTRVLADDATNQIAATGRSVVCVPGVQLIPGVTIRDYTLFNENWLRPIRDWYNSDTSSFNYASLGADKSDAVLEVALVNYSVALENRLLVQVMVKLVDPLTGKTIGRARDWDNPEIENLDKVLSDNGKKLKQVFAHTGSGLINKCLYDLGIIEKK